MDTVGTTEINVQVPPSSTAEVSSSQLPAPGTSLLPVVEETTSLVVLPPRTKIGDSPALTAVLLAQLKVSRRGFLAVTYLDAEEYGFGQTEYEAVLDLVSSLAEYKDSLEKRENKLAQEGLADLAKLRRLFDPTSS